jgi:cytidine kinase
MSLLVIGSLAFDDIETDHGTITNAPGGSALYCAAAASFFAPVALLGVVGDDFPAEEIAFLRTRGIDTTHLDVIPGGKTFRWGGRYETDMNKRTTTNLELNVFTGFNPVLSGGLEQSDFIFLGNIDPDLQINVLNQAKNARFTGADTIECYIHDKPEQLLRVLERVDLILINDDEARLITSKHNILTAAQELLNLGPRYAVIKKGEHGSILASREGLFIVPAFPVRNVIDPTGAGDSFAGAMFGYLAQQGAVTPESVRKAIVYGGIVASFTVEDFSLRRLKQITHANIEERLSNFRTMTRF